MSPPPDEITPSPPESGNANPAAEAASSTASSEGSPTSAAFVADPGPAFDADAASELPPPEPAAILDVEWDEQTVRGLLTAKGEVLHMALAVDKESDEWRYTRGDLTAIAPPLTRILNRYDATRAAAGTGDELALIIGLTGYVGRSIAERRVALAHDRVDDGPEPITGVPADPITADDDWQVGS